jgi:predicted SAM-dependent methyltransferase
VRVELACGERVEKGWVGVDISAEVKPTIQHDLRIFPWPFDPGEIEESRCSHFFEHLYPKERVGFMNELHRATRAGGLAHFTTPFNLWRMVQDFDHKWPPIVEGSYKYFDKGWLQSQRLSHYRKLFGIACDWKLEKSGVIVSEDRNPPDFADPREIMDLVVTLKRRP